MSHAAFWKSICAEPDDDTPRLVYADWLDEQGNAAAAKRAEFIRAQVEFARIEPWTARAVELKLRFRQLRHEHEEAWAAQLPKWARRAVAFRRGMPYGLFCSARDFARNAGGLAKNTPLQEVRLNHLDMAGAEKIAALPQLTRMRELNLSGYGWAAWASVLAAPHLTGLRALALRDQGRDTPFAQYSDILQLPSLRGLQRLRLGLHEGRPDTAGAFLRALYQSPLRSLRNLHLSGFHTPAAGLATLFRSALGSQLVSVRLEYIGDQVLAGIARAPEVPALKSFAFEASDRHAELSAAFRAPLFSHLASLEIEGLGDDGLRALAESPIAEGLSVLDLGFCTARKATYRKVFASGRFRELVELAIPMGTSGTTWKPDQNPLDVIAVTPGLENLRHLDLRECAWRTPDFSLDGLAESEHLPNLRGVTLSSSYRHGQLSNFAELKAFGAKYAGRFEVLVDTSEL